MLTCPLPGLAARCKLIPSQSTSSSWLEDSSTGSTYALFRFPILFGVANPRLRSSQVLDSHNRPCLTERALLSNLTAILSDANRTPQNQVAQSALGVLSTERRAIWAGHRERLSKDPGNSMCLDVLDKALFVVCLDDANPETASEQCANMLCGTYKLDKGVQVGTCTNRYYDKVCYALRVTRNSILLLGTPTDLSASQLQIIVAANGAAGVNFEHSGVDGHTVLRYILAPSLSPYPRADRYRTTRSFVADVYTELILRFAKSINSASATLFKAKISPWAKGAGKKVAPANGAASEPQEEIDTVSDGKS
jgi:carnitine O-acetyltransferase